MFLHIKPSPGVFTTSCERISTPSMYENVEPLKLERYLNLSQILSVFPEKVGALDQSGGAPESKVDEWAAVEQAHSLCFAGEYNRLTLIFTQEGMGEYNRIKRIVTGEK